MARCAREFRGDLCFYLIRVVKIEISPVTLMHGCSIGGEVKICMRKCRTNVLKGEDIPRSWGSLKLVVLKVGGFEVWWFCKLVV